ncbi:MAG: zinc metallopeptidase [Clostridia bacterium]|nr:zinc metallopeptidase [Clostridia bacterium]
MYWYDFQGLMFLIPALLLSLIAQIVLKATYSKYSKVPSATGMTGFAAARRILDAAGLYNVQIEQISGDLTDHFDPKVNVLRLSSGVYQSSTVAAIGVAAHECGHAMQYAEDYGPMKLRGALVKSTNISSSLSFIVVLLGLFFGIVEIAWVGVILFGVVVFFQLVTLPVEFNASRRAVAVLEGYLPAEENKGVRKVLTAAAMTYVAALAGAILQLLRLITLVSGSRRR